MYYFLAIVLEQNITDGTFWPAYILCQSYTTSEKRSGWRIIRQVDGVPTSSLPKVLVTEPTGHDEMIQFMSSYQRMDWKTKKHMHPVGALCWFSCNQYGDPTGEAIFVKRIPDFVWWFDFSQKGYQQLKKTLAHKAELKELFTSDSSAEKMKHTDTKMRLHQTTKHYDREKRRGRNARKENGIK